VSSYQSVSGTGLAAMDELTQGMRALVDDQQPQSLLYPRQIAGNVIPQCDAFNGDWTLEELKIMNESAKILKESVTIHPTCVRVPVYQGHHLAVTVKFNKDIDRATLESIIHHQSRLTLCDRDSYPSSVAVVGSDNVFVSRMRHAPKDLSTWSFWLSADNIRVGAATNAMNILHMIRDRCIK
jgi:aspartate-semialdehyde dehydrogenase